MTLVKLIVNADDFNRSEGVNQGIMRAHLEGIVSTTTVMMNLGLARERLQTARDKCPRLGFGVHLNITFGRPLYPPTEVPSLVDKDGLFLKLKDHLAASGRIDLGDLEREWMRQIDRFLELGIPLDHLDSHHHTAVLSQPIFELFLEIADRYGCGVRNPKPWDLEFSDIRSIYPEPIVQFVLQDTEWLLKSRSIAHPDGFLSSFFGPGVTLAHLTQLISSLPSGRFELMCHPGVLDAPLASGSSYSKMREKELEVLTNPKIRSLLEAGSIEVHTFRTAWID